MPSYVTAAWCQSASVGTAGAMAIGVMPTMGWFSPGDGARRALLEVGDEHAVRRPDPEEVVHVDVAVLAFRAPLGHEGNRVDSAGARAGRDARAVAPEPGLDGEVRGAEPGAGPNVT